MSLDLGSPIHDRFRRKFKAWVKDYMDVEALYKPSKKVAKYWL